MITEATPDTVVYYVDVDTETGAINVIAAYPDRVHQDGCIDAVVPVYAYSNSPVCAASVFQEGIAWRLEITERAARNVHPALFAYLDA